jgi:hypothetical protein
VHAVKQSPQCIASVLVFTQTPEQSVAAPVHVIAHEPKSQRAPDGHAMPHPPQLRGSLSKSTHVAPHGICVPVHTGGPPPVHVPMEQSAPFRHAEPHAPQFAGSWTGSTHRAPHAMSGAAQLAAHEPAWQREPVAHAFAQCPQFRSSREVSTHALPHIVCPLGQRVLVASTTATSERRPPSSDTPSWSCAHAEHASAAPSSAAQTRFTDRRCRTADRASTPPRRPAMVAASVRYPRDA